MIVIAIIVGCIIGALIGVNMPTISYTYSGYLAIAIIAALDSVFGGITSILKKNFDMKIFLSGFFVNAILAMALTYLGQKLNLDIYLAALVVFVWRMFDNLGAIRRYYVEKITTRKIIAKAEATIKKANEEKDGPTSPKKKKPKERKQKVDLQFLSISLVI